MWQHEASRPEKKEQIEKIENESSSGKTLQQSDWNESNYQLLLVFLFHYCKKEI